MTTKRSGNQLETRNPGLLVELSRKRGDDQFTCTLPDWSFIRDLGRTFGWHPTGTTYLPQQGERARHNPIKHDYQPGDSQDRKRVESDDAAHWAAALDGARRSPFIAGMVRNHVQRQANDTDADRSLHLLLGNFIEFARRGGFTIALRQTNEHASEATKVQQVHH